MSSAPTLARIGDEPKKLTQDEQLTEMNRKLDLLTEQVGHLYARTVALEELKDELVRIARDGMAALTVELEAMEHEFNAEEITHLVRQLVRSTPRMINLLEMLESFEGFASEMTPLSKEIMRDVVQKLAVAEERGYFRMVEGGIALFDRVASHYCQDDIDKLSDNIVVILDTVKRMTQPEMLSVANKAIGAIDLQDGGEAKPLGVWGMLRAMRDPDVQEGLGVMVDLLRRVARSRNGHGTPALNEGTQTDAGDGVVRR